MADKAELGEEYEDERDETASATGKTRMVDWLQCCKLPVAFSVIGFLALYSAIGNLRSGSTSIADLIPKTREDAAVAVLLAAYLLLGPLAVWAQLMGTVFDGPRDTLSFPMYVLRRRVRLSEIRDANAQTITKPAFQMTNTIIGLISVGQIKGLGNTKRYFVNLSGEFGSRRITFHAKYKRDQFLSLLRAYAPDCRITRWV
ncbi:MAG: hypothetical protein AB7I42_27635 [Bradyrhizobium sp.]|uniref:hypothetical protein n=1 Tax=Bradyrhizobium sp. TaxID=376 RepID=UPI003D0AE4B2